MGKFLEDRVNLHSGVIPWLPEFVPKVGLKIVVSTSHFNHKYKHKNYLKIK